MAGHCGADEAIALALLVLGAPFFAEFVCVLGTFDFLAGEFSLVALASTAGGLSNTGSGPFAVLGLLVHHSALLSLLKGSQRDRPASVPQSLLNLACIKTLLFDGLLDAFNFLAFLIGSPVLFE